jgi:glycosyltransferase involved in cell wall biosynthesis
MGPLPDVSVVVPTRDRPASLARCLAALGRQEDCGTLEIVVVDDGSRDASAVSALVERTPEARLVQGGGRGPAAARNVGIAAARADLVCMTDDDCEPVPVWAARLTRRLRGGADAVAGPTEIADPGDSLVTATQTIVDYLASRPGGRPPTMSFAPTSNLATTASVTRALPFDERYVHYGEDRDWCARLVASGRALEWEPEAVVRHHQELTMASFLQKHAGYGRGSWRFRHENPAFRQLEPAGFYAGLVGAGFRRSAGVGALVCLAQLATAAGFVREALSRQAP